MQYTGVWYESGNSGCSLVLEFNILRHCSLDAGLDRSDAPNIVQITAPKSLQSHNWLTARITGGKTKIPFTLRLQDVGDFYSVDYVRAWLLTAQKHSECKFWFYTRSFIDTDVFAELTKLASLPNCQGWLSVDSENFEEALLAICKAPSGVWKLALLQDKELNSDIIPAFESLEARVDIVNFPYHRSGRYVEPVRHSLLTSCPAVVGSLALQPQKDSLRPCQACTFCLP